MTVEEEGPAPCPIGPDLVVDVCVIGAGSGGLSVAAGAVQMGASVALIEKGEMGGDCLNAGCVPSKALLAAAKRGEPAPYDYVRDVIRAIAPNDSQARFEGLGVTVIRGAARFVCGNRVEAAGRTVRARRFVIATGSRAAVPPIPGLEVVPYLTNETLFRLTKVPEHLIVVGGGPIGVEMAQAHRRLGARVTVLEMATLLPRDDPELVEVVRLALRRDGVDIREGVRIEGVETGPVVHLEDGGRIEGSHLLIAAGRRPNVQGLNLDAAGIAHGPQGIRVDARLRTTNPKIYAIGDVIGGPQFTHAAGHQAGIVLRNILFKLPAKVDYKALPWCTYTDPELAWVGLSEEAARAQGPIRVLRWPFAENDRARAEGGIDGLVKVIATPKGRILGAGIAGPQAGELIQTWVLAISQGIKLGAVAGMIAPYPTRGEASKRAAGSFFAPMLFGARTRGLVRFLMRFS
jgi:pyruvate/2-oxoglutarate dehydrogenase complex dihydrolipoamide dehydrogenase (E3) component